MELTALYYSLLGSILFLSVVFGIAWYRSRFDLIDVAWGLAFIAIALISYTTHYTFLYSLQTLVTALVVIWGFRLSLHIYARWDTSKAEDKRYKALRDQYKNKSGGLLANMYLRVFLVQAILVVVVSLPVIVVNASHYMKPSILTLIGLIIWVIGFYFEAVGDYQLKKHVANPKNKGKLMTSGLWRYTRHPNYFGELTQWWGIFIIALPFSYWWLGLVGPVVLTILLLFVSGVPLTEKHFKGRKGWDEYKHRTSPFLPLPPKKS